MGEGIPPHSLLPRRLRRLVLDASGVKAQARCTPIWALLPQLLKGGAAPARMYG